MTGVPVPPVISMRIPVNSTYWPTPASSSVSGPHERELVDDVALDGRPVRLHGNINNHAVPDTDDLRPPGRGNINDSSRAPYAPLPQVPDDLPVERRRVVQKRGDLREDFLDSGLVVAAAYQPLGDKARDRREEKEEEGKV